MFVFTLGQNNGSNVVKLGARHICCPLLVLSLEDVLVKLMFWALGTSVLDYYAALNIIKLFFISPIQDALKCAASGSQLGLPT